MSDKNNLDLEKEVLNINLIVSAKIDKRNFIFSDFATPKSYLSACMKLKFLHRNSDQLYFSILDHNNFGNPYTVSTKISNIDNDIIERLSLCYIYGSITIIGNRSFSLGSPGSYLLIPTTEPNHFECFSIVVSPEGNLDIKQKDSNFHIHFIYLDLVSYNEGSFLNTSNNYRKFFYIAADLVSEISSATRGEDQHLTHYEFIELSSRIATTLMINNNGR